MRVSFLALIGLAALNGKFGADATAIPNDLELSSPSPAVRNLEAFTVEKPKRAVAVPNLPRAPVDPAPVDPAPVPEPAPAPELAPAPEPVTPDPGTSDPDISESDTSESDTSEPDAPDVVTPEPVTPEQPIKPEPVKPEPIGSKPNGGKARAPRYLPDDMSFEEPNPCPKVKRGEKLSRTCTDVSQVPSVEKIMEYLNVPPNKAVFYAGPGGYHKKSVDWIEKKASQSSASDSGYKNWSDFWEDKSLLGQYKGDAGLLFDTRASEAMAKLASGEVHVLLPSDTKGTEWTKGTVWDVNEYPNLGAAVTKIIRVNPDNDEEEEIPKKS